MPPTVFEGLQNARWVKEAALYYLDPIFKFVDLDLCL
jgi:hypothetical protein